MGDVLYNSISNYQRVSVLHNHIYIQSIQTLIGGIPTPLKKYMRVRWNDDIPNIYGPYMGKQKTCSKPSTSIQSIQQSLQSPISADSIHASNDDGRVGAGLLHLKEEGPAGVGVGVDSIWQWVKTNSTPSVHIKIAGEWMFIPLKMLLIGIDSQPYDWTRWNKIRLGWDGLD